LEYPGSHVKSTTKGNALTDGQEMVIYRRRRYYKSLLLMMYARQAGRQAGSSVCPIPGLSSCVTEDGYFSTEMGLDADLRFWVTPLPLEKEVKG